MDTLLAKVTVEDVITDPFPHIVIRDPIDDALCCQLIDKYPSLETITKNKEYDSNARFSYSAAGAMQNPSIHALWQAFCLEHVSQNFFNQFVQIFEPSILELYPNFEKDFGSLKGFKSGVRKVDEIKDVDIVLDAQICVNTPVTKPSSVRGPHVDLPDKLFAGLFYMRPPGDETTGGDLEIYRFPNRQVGRVFDQVYVDASDIEYVKTVKYERNVLVLFINSLYSLHGVTVREPTDKSRLFFNLVGEVKHPLFDLRPYQKPNL